MIRRSLVRSIPVRVARAAETILDPRSAELGPLLDRIGDARVVLLGEATHGSAEFYELRARITRALVEEKGFSFVALEADWPDAARIDDYVQHRSDLSGWSATARFPTWMWRNAEFLSLVEWVRERDAMLEPGRRTAIYGLDLYSLYTSIEKVLEHLGEVDEETARIARQRYACLSPWEGRPVEYGLAATTPWFESCEEEVLATLRGLLEERLEAEASGDRRRMFHAVQNARLVADAERYYRTLYFGSIASWNLRDTHMFETLQAILAFHGPGARGVVWAHNSHLGDARATELGRRGELNLGQLCRLGFGEEAFLLGFGTDHGTVAAAHDWDEPMEVMEVRPALPESYEGLCHEAGVGAFFLSLRDPELRETLHGPRLERAIGVVYRPRTERESHYFEARLSDQFDEYAWIDETSAVTPLEAVEVGAVPDTYPFGE